MINDYKLKKVVRQMRSIETPRLVLKKICAENAEDMYAYSRIDDVTRYLLWTPHLNLFETKGYIDYLQRQYKRGAFADWGINFKEDGRFIGTCGFTSFDHENNRGEIGYVLSPEYRGRGIMHEAVGAVLSVAFIEIELGAVTIRVIEGNQGSVNVGKRFGFVFDSTARQYIKGEYKTVNTYILDREKYIASVCT